MNFKKLFFSLITLSTLVGCDFNASKSKQHLVPPEVNPKYIVSKCVFDNYDSDKPNFLTNPDNVTFEEFPNATFTWTYNGLIINDETVYDNTPLITIRGTADSRFNIRSIFAGDVNKDGHTDVCISYEIGGGNYSTGYILYDYINKAILLDYEIEANQGEETKYVYLSLGDSFCLAVNYSTGLSKEIEPYDRKYVAFDQNEAKLM